MKILLLAPHPFYQERGTPIAVDLLLRVLSERGDTVDVLTYHEGDPRAYPNVTTHRIPRLPFVRDIRPGLSGKKLLCDAFLALRALRMARGRRYDLVHAVEESVFIAMLLRRFFRTPYVFDMDSSMPLQIVDKAPHLRFLLPFMTRCEAAAVRGAAAVVPVCEALERQAETYGAKQTVLLQDVSLLDPGRSLPPRDLKRELNISGACFLYLGNLETYQGIDLLLESFALLAQAHPGCGLVIAGGQPADIEKYKQKSVALGIGAAAHFIGPQPLRHMESLFAGADILVSPRTQGSNTPMKIYSYLDSGRPILATRLPTHTQALDDSVALLAAPQAEDFSAAMGELAGDAALRTRLATAARARALAKHSFGAFRYAARSLYNSLERDVCGQNSTRTQSPS
jgi:glycosyltransferase involved in cell wall biosynthesis